LCGKGREGGGHIEVSASKWEALKGWSGNEAGKEEEEEE
jgi:hypothetical protein